MFPFDYDKFYKQLFWLMVSVLMIHTHRVDAQQVKGPDARTLLSYQTCKSDADCKENSICHGNTENSQGLCKCFDEYLIIRNRKTYDCVLPAKTIGSDCVFDEQCEFTLGIDSECDAKHKCRCLPESHFVEKENHCYKTSYLNQTCVEHLNCLPNHPDDDVFCTNGKCTCGLKQLPNAAGKCVVVRRLGEKCDERGDDYCLSMNAVCRVVCICKTGYVVENDERYCLKAAIKLFDSCTQHSQCETFIHNSECVRGRCQCQSGFHQYANNCYQPRSIGSLCNSKGECVAHPALEDRVDCVDSICRCNPGLDFETCEDTSSDTVRPTNHHNLQLTALGCSVLLFLFI